MCSDSRELVVKMESKGAACGQDRIKMESFWLMCNDSSELVVKIESK